MTWNLPTIILGLIVLAVFVAIVAGGIRKRRRGGHSCSCGGGCGGCACSGMCHPKKD
ncbi:MAG: FeoB-associated Cys-rich membrane protein [Ruthenibacterium sp.]